MIYACLFNGIVCVKGTRRANVVQAAKRCRKKNGHGHALLSLRKVENAVQIKDTVYWGRRLRTLAEI